MNVAIRPLKLWLLLAGAVVCADEPAPPAEVVLRHPAAVSAIAFSPDGKTIASGAWDQTVRLWNVADGKEIRSFTGHHGEVECVAFAPNGKSIASGGWDKTVRLWDAADGRELRRFGPHADGVLCLAFAADGKTLASGNMDRTGKEGTLHLWDVADGKRLQTLPGHTSPVTALAFSADGKHLVSGSADASVRVWDLADTATSRQLTGHDGWVFSVAFAPDGQTIASAGGDKTVRLWDLAAGKVRYPLTGHQDKVRAVAYSRDGRTLVSAGFDKTVRFWEVASGKERLQTTGHRAGVRALAFSPDDSIFASAGSDKTLRLSTLRGLILDGQPAKAKLTDDERAALWEDLAAADGTKGYRAVALLSAAPAGALSLLDKQLRPAQAAYPKKLAALIADLDADNPGTRLRAAKELTDLDDLAQPALEAALKTELSPDARRRIGELLEQLRRPTATPERLRGNRALEVLEQIGDAEAKRVLEALSKGTPEAWLTREAKASLERLGRRP